ncbi:hypothetical protein D3C78_1101490 [compost metagenome]
MADIGFHPTCRFCDLISQARRIDLAHIHMRHGMGTKMNQRIFRQRPELIRIHDEFVHDRDGIDAMLPRRTVNSFHRLVFRKVLDEIFKPRECLRFLRRVGACHLLRPRPEIEFERRGLLRQGSGGFPPKAACSLDKARRDENRVRHGIFAEDRRCMIGIVAIAIIKREGAE